MHDATALPPPRQAPARPAADARRDRLDAIRNSAIVARRVAVSALYRKLPDGRHVITHRGRTWIGDTLAEAITAAKGRQAG